MNRKAFLTKIDRITDLPTLPEVAMQVNRLMENQTVTVKEIGKTIEKDQAIVLKLLRLVNSSFFGLREKVSSVSWAVVILGFNTIRNAVISVSVIDSLKGMKNSRLDMKAFWRHAISCAVVSGHLASKCGMGAPEDAFTAGLIHDMGKLVLAKYFPEEFARIMVETETGKSFYEAEKDIIPMHHNQIGVYLTKRWRLPPVVNDAVRYSHGAGDYDRYPVAGIVCCADTIVNMKTAEAVISRFKWPRCGNAGKLRGYVEKLDEWFPEIEDEIETACLMLLGGEENGR